MLGLSQAAKLKEKIEKMFSGDKVPVVPCNHMSLLPV
jgi:hypothetical protein